MLKIVFWILSMTVNATEVFICDYTYQQELECMLLSREIKEDVSSGKEYNASTNSYEDDSVRVSEPNQTSSEGFDLLRRTDPFIPLFPKYEDFLSRIKEEDEEEE